MKVNKRTPDQRATTTTKAIEPRKPPALNISLPSEKSEPISDISKAVMFLYGEKKIGKTSLAAQYPDAFFLMFEPGGKGLRIFQKAIPDWRTFVGFIQLLKANPAKFKTVVIDTVDIAYDLCFQFVCEREHISHPSDVTGDYGKTWDKINSEFKKQISLIMDSGRGVIFVSHADDKDFLERSGKNYTKVVPTVKKQGRKFISGVADIMAYYGYYGNERRLIIRGNENLEAGQRLEERFLTTTGQRVCTISMGQNPQEAYENLQRGFRNELTDVGDTDALPSQNVEQSTRRKVK